MKKILTFLAAAGLVSAAGAATTGCGCAAPEVINNHDQPDNSCDGDQDQTWKAKVQPTNIAWTLTQTKAGHELTKTDQQLLKQEIIKRFRSANEGVIINEQNLIFDLTKVTPESSELKIHVQDTKGNASTMGTRCGNLVVNLYLTIAENHIQVEIPKPFPVQLEETKSGFLTESDQALLQKTIIKQIKQNNQGANITPNAFEFDLKIVDVQTKKIEVIVKGTKPNKNQRGIGAGVIEITFNLLPANL